MVGQTDNNRCAHRAVGYYSLSNVLQFDVVRSMSPAREKLRRELPNCRLCELYLRQLRLVRLISVVHARQHLEHIYGGSTHSFGSLGSHHSGIVLPFTREDFFSIENWDSELCE